MSSPRWKEVKEALNAVLEMRPVERSAYLARLNRKVAIKVLPRAFSADPERLRRFGQEARAVAALSHPNVAHIYEIGECEGLRYIAMEYVQGETLRARIAQGGVKPELALEIAEQIASALAAAHAAGIVHRDIKPENIMV